MLKSDFITSDFDIFGNISQILGFTGQLDALMHRFNASLPVDQHLHSADVEGSKNYAQALFQCQLLTEEGTFYPFENILESLFLS
jgi:argininosuccinate lyase